MLGRRGEDNIVNEEDRRNAEDYCFDAHEV